MALRRNETGQEQKSGQRWVALTSSVWIYSKCNGKTVVGFSKLNQCNLIVPVP